MLTHLAVGALIGATATMLCVYVWSWAANQR